MWQYNDFEAIFLFLGVNSKERTTSFVCKKLITVGECRSRVRAHDGTLPTSSDEFTTDVELSNVCVTLFV